MVLGRQHFPHCSRKVSVTTASHRFDFESHTRKTGDAFHFQAVIGRHHRFAVDVWGTLRKVDNRQEIAGQTTCYRESCSASVLWCKC